MNEYHENFGKKTLRFYFHLCRMKASCLLVDYFGSILMGLARKFCVGNKCGL